MYRGIEVDFCGVIGMKLAVFKHTWDIFGSQLDTFGLKDLNFFGNIGNIPITFSYYNAIKRSLKMFYTLRKFKTHF